MQQKPALGGHVGASLRNLAWTPAVEPIALGIAVGIGYFLAARLSLFLLIPTDGVAVFWPAAGIAAGVLIALGPKIRLPVAACVMAATVAANLQGDRNLASAIVFAFANAGEALFAAWLIRRRFGSDFSLDNVHHVLAFFAAIVGAAVVAGAIAAAGIVLFHNLGAPVLTIWFNWSASDALGAITVAPLIIGVAHAFHNVPETGEIVEGTLVLAALAAVSVITLGTSSDLWFTVAPLGLILPLLLWLAARCQPLFTAIGVFIIALVIVWTTTFGVGRLGAPGIADLERVHAARAALLVVSLCGFILAALFAERRHGQVALAESNEQLRLAVDGAELGVWSLDLVSGRFKNDARDRQIHGHNIEAPPRTLAEARRFIHPDDLALIDKGFRASGRARSNYKVDYRLVPTTGSTWERWVALEGTVVRDANGRPLRLLGVTRDITERKNAEQALAERNMQLDLAGKVALVGTFAFDVLSDRMTISPGYAAIHGLPEGSEECSRAGWRARVHPDDVLRLDARFEQTVAARRQDHHCDYRIIRPDGEVRWIESRSIISYDGDGPRLLGANIDVTDRKRVERALSERDVQLSLAGKAAGVGSYAYDVGSDLMQITAGYAALHDLPEGTRETARSGWVARAHPEDRARIEGTKIQAFREHREECGIEYRIVRPGGEVRWIESRSFISYDDDNRPQRVIGLNIDITERRRAEDRQRALTAELDHRVKNVLATVSAVAASTLETSSSMQHFVAALDARIRALASIHELLSTRRWQGLPLDELLRRQLAPYAAHNNTRLYGPDVLLMAEAGQAVAMVLHELVTNAAKYGALSTQKGLISVQWRWPQHGAARDRLIIDWREIDGPTVKHPGKFGYGTSVINDLVPYELGGNVDFEYAPTGVHCRLEIPAKWTISARQTSPDLHRAGSSQARSHEARLINEVHSWHG